MGKSILPLRLQRCIGHLTAAVYANARKLKAWREISGYSEVVISPALARIGVIYAQAILASAGLLFSTRVSEFPALALARLRARSRNRSLDRLA